MKSIISVLQDFIHKLNEEDMPMIYVKFLLRNILIRKSKLDETQVWVYIVDLPPSQMIEYGAVLPESGKESEWFTNLSTKLKKKLSTIEN